MIDRIWEAAQEEIVRGYGRADDAFICHVCGKKYEIGVVYEHEGAFYEAEKAMRLHVQREHGSVFESLLSLDKRLTGLSAHQVKLISLFHSGKSDVQIQREMGIGSSATIRAHRFMLREKERQARIFLALMTLLRKEARMLPARRAASNRGGRKDAVKRLFSEGRLTTLDLKEKNRIAVAAEIAGRFEPGRVYAEKEVNALLQPVFDDYLALRRCLIDTGFLERKADGSEYWLKEQEAPAARPAGEAEDMEKERRRELARQYRQMKTVGGVYRIINRQNEKILVASTNNLKTVGDKSVAMERCAFRNREFAEDLRRYGEDAFAIEILESLEEEDDIFFEMSDRIRQLEKKWIERLQPFGDRGYNK